MVYVAGAGTGGQAGVMQATTVSGNLLTLLNSAGGNAVPGNVVPNNALVTPGGPIGQTGAQGIPGPVGPSGSTTWTGISGKPSVFPPSPHTHVESDVTNLVADLNNRVLTSTTVTGSKSLTGGGALGSGAATLSLVNDAADPGASRFYATNVSDVRGWIPYGTAALVNVAPSGNATNAQAVLGSDTRLADSRPPKAHAASHGSGGSDQVSLLRAQISDLPGLVNTTSMGFVPQLPTVNPTTVYFRGDGSYSPVTVSGSSIFVPWSNIIGAPLATVGAPGLLRALNPATPVPGSGSQTQVWCRGDDSWQVLPVTTYTNATFNIPVLGASTSVAVNPSPEWPQVTSCVYFSDGTTRGFLECSATGAGPYTSVTLTNRGFALNAATGTLVNTGAILSLRGPSVASGSTTGLLPSLPTSTPNVRFLDGTGNFNLLPAPTTSTPGSVPVLPPVSGANSQTKTWLRGDDSFQGLPEVSYLSAGFTVPAIGATVVTQLYAPYPGWPGAAGAAVYFTDGTNRGYLGISAYNASNGALTLINRGNATPGANVAVDCLLRLDGPGALASASNAGILALLSGAATDYVGGDNACHPNPTARYYGTDTTNATNYAVTVASDFALVAGVVVWVTPSLTNAASPTLNVNGSGAKALVNRANIAFSANEFPATKTFGAMYDGTSWRVFTTTGRAYLAAAPGTVTVECAGYDWVHVRVTVAVASATALTLAHLALGVPVTLSISNTYSAVNTYTVAVTNSAGTAGTAYVTFAASPSGAATISLASVQNLTNGNAFVYVGSMDANNELLLR